MKYSLLKRSRILLFLFCYFILAAAIELLTGIMSIYRINNIFIGNLFFLVQFTALSFILSNWIQYEMVKKVLSFVLVLVFISGTCRIIYINPLNELDNVSIALESVVLILISGSALFSVSNETEISLLKNPKFWFCSAVFVYFSLNIAVFCTGSYVLENEDYLRKYTWVINSLLTIVTNIFYSIGILWLRPKKI